MYVRYIAYLRSGQGHPRQLFLFASYLAPSCGAYLGRYPTRIATKRGVGPASARVPRGPRPSRGQLRNRKRRPRGALRPDSGPSLAPHIIIIIIPARRRAGFLSAFVGFSSNVQPAGSPCRRPITSSDRSLGAVTCVADTANHPGRQEPRTTDLAFAKRGFEPYPTDKKTIHLQLLGKVFRGGPGEQR